MSTSAPIRKQITVAATPERSFEVFTAGMGRWWNRQYSIGSEEMTTVVVEGHEGGRWFERGVHGAECEWGRVLVWEPPQRVVLDWQITGEWRYDPEVHTELDVQFVADAGGTRVELEHRGLESLGAQADGIREIFDGPGGWAGLLQGLLAVAAGGDA